MSFAKIINHYGKMFRSPVIYPILVYYKSLYQNRLEWYVCLVRFFVGLLVEPKD